MEKTAAPGAIAGNRWDLRLRACAAAALCIACPAAWSQDGGASPSQVLAGEAPVRLEVQTSSLPRLDAQDSGFQAPRVDIALFPSRPSGIGAVVGMSGFTAQQGLHPAGLQPIRPSVDLGVRFSHTLQSQQQVDVTAWRRMNADTDAYTLVQMRQPVYGARVEMNLSPKKKSGLATGLGFIGLQLESGARISLKRKDGRPMIYYRTSF